METSLATEQRRLIKIVGCDFHAGHQQIAVAGTLSGQVKKLRLTDLTVMPNGSTGCLKVTKTSSHSRCPPSAARVDGWWNLIPTMIRRVRECTRVIGPGLQERLWYAALVSGGSGRIEGEGVDDLAGAGVVQVFAGLVLDDVGIGLEQSDVALEAIVFVAQQS